MKLVSDLNPKLFDKDVEQTPTRNGYGDGLVQIGKKNKDVVVLTGDLAESTRAHKFQQEFPDRFVECGVAEQNMMGVAAGLALAGKIPFVSSYAVFVPGRNWDQLRVSVCYSNANVKVAGAHAGISVGPDGATHQALEDIAITRVLPGLTVIVPCDYEEAKKCTIAVSKMKGPVYFRFAREKTPHITTSKTTFIIGKNYVCNEGKDVTIAACGPLLYEALLASKDLEAKKISAEVINCHTIKPFDEETLVTSVQKTGACVTVEEHQITGGLNGAVSETLGRHHPVPIEAVGMPNRFGESGQPDELLKKYGMKAKDIVKAVEKVLKRK
ncbi:transketolase family protein [Candidatus Uhrbacteria bacterium]|nr:transketolase family protein [Candidatus Uhrbacteria bacterium]MBD3284414.1 transketolase family protein [Candidatus Uhrbacteria bacterium]